MWRTNKATIGVGAVVVAGILAYNYYDMKEMSDLSQQTYLRLYGEGIYEYHALTGKGHPRLMTWPLPHCPADTRTGGKLNSPSTLMPSCVRRT
jgi:hypothetical protein